MSDTPNLPYYNLSIFPVRVKTPKVGAPANFTQEMYDLWIADEEHIRLEQQADEGRLFFWNAQVTEGAPTDSTQTVELHSEAFDIRHNTVAVNFKLFLKELTKVVTDRATKTMGDDERRILGPHE